MPVIDSYSATIAETPMSFKSYCNGRAPMAKCIADHYTQRLLRHSRDSAAFSGLVCAFDVHSRLYWHKEILRRRRSFSRTSIALIDISTIELTELARVQSSMSREKQTTLPSEPFQRHAEIGENNQEIDPPETPLTHAQSLQSSLCALLALTSPRT